MVASVRRHRAELVRGLPWLGAGQFSHPHLSTTTRAGAAADPRSRPRHYPARPPTPICRRYRAPARTADDTSGNPHPTRSAPIVGSDGGGFAMAAQLTPGDAEADLASDEDDRAPQRHGPGDRDAFRATCGTGWTVLPPAVF